MEDNCARRDFLQRALIRPALTWARDESGRPVDTLFSLWKRTWPRSRTMFITGKAWLAELFGTGACDIDMCVTGREFPPLSETRPEVEHV